METVIVLFEGFDELDAIGPYEVLRNAAEAGADVAVSLATLDGRDRVRASHGLRIEADGRLGDLTPDLLVVPGGGWTDGSTAGVRAEVERGDLPEAVAGVHGAGATVAAVCTGGMILERAGLLDGRPATTHRAALPDLRESAARVVDARVVDTQDVLTAGGVTSGLDLALHLVRREFGADVADAVAREMAHDPSEDVFYSNVRGEGTEGDDASGPEGGAGEREGTGSREATESEGANGESGRRNIGESG